jgi:hypothetical protein
MTRQPGGACSAGRTPLSARREAGLMTTGSSSTTQPGPLRASDHTLRISGSAQSVGFSY